MRAASWLLARFGVDESLTGDLIEQRRVGRSALWLWRQALIAVVHRIGSVVTRDPAVVGVAAVVVAVDVALPYVWMLSFMRYAALQRYLAGSQDWINWLAAVLPRALFQIVVFLHVWAWSGMAAWCALLGAMARCLVGIWPKWANLIVATFVLSNLCQTLPYLEQSFLDWARDPLNPVWASNFVCYGFFALFAIPASIVIGGKRDRQNAGSTVSCQCD